MRQFQQRVRQDLYNSSQNDLKCHLLRRRALTCAFAWSKTLDRMPSWATPALSRWTSCRLCMLCILQWTDRGCTERLWGTHVHVFILIYLYFVCFLVCFCFFLIAYDLHTNIIWIYMNIIFASLMHLSLSLCISPSRHANLQRVTPGFWCHLAWDSMLPNCVAWERSMKSKSWHIKCLWPMAFLFRCYIVERRLVCLCVCNRLTVHISTYNVCHIESTIS